MDVKRALKSLIQTSSFHNAWNGLEQHPKRTQCHLELFLIGSGISCVAHKERLMLNLVVLWLAV